MISINVQLLVALTSYRIHKIHFCTGLLYQPFMFISLLFNESKKLFLMFFHGSYPKVISTFQNINCVILNICWWILEQIVFSFPQINIVNCISILSCGDYFVRKTIHTEIAGIWKIKEIWVWRKKILFCCCLIRFAICTQKPISTNGSFYVFLTDVRECQSTRTGIMNSIELWVEKEKQVAKLIESCLFGKKHKKVWVEHVTVAS